MKKFVMSLALISGLLLSGCGHMSKHGCNCGSEKACACDQSKKDAAGGGCQDCKDKK